MKNPSILEECLQDLNWFLNKVKLSFVCIFNCILVNTIPVSDVVRAYKKKKNIWGIDGYDFPSFDAHLDKIRTHKIVNDKKLNFID